MKQTEVSSTMSPLATKINIPPVTQNIQQKISKWNLMKIFVLIVFITLLSLLMDDNISWDYTAWKPIQLKYKDYVVWHYGFTMAVLEFLGKKRTLANCRLILVETR